MSSLLIQGRAKDLGGFQVHRVLPHFSRRNVGPFVFLDHMGPMQVDETHGLDVRPHPHIGLATVTYLFEGRGLHRDSLGSVQIIEPGDLNLMTAGRGIVHSERTPEEDRRGGRAHGIQIWLGLPTEHEEDPPAFRHWPRTEFPSPDLGDGFETKLLMGEWSGQRSPVPTLWPTLFVDIKSHAGARAGLSFAEAEVALFVASGACEVDGQSLGAEDLLVVADPGRISLASTAECRLIIIGGAPFPEPRYIWWNFVSSQKERIHAAAERWRRQSFGQVEGETDFIPLPDSPLP
jgi:redox-sensitive bicupin YhaK (pirin superfamily)